MLFEGFPSDRFANVNGRSAEIILVVIKGCLGDGETAAAIV